MNENKKIELSDVIKDFGEDINTRCPGFIDDKSYTPLQEELIHDLEEACAKCKGKQSKRIKTLRIEEYIRLAYENNVSIIFNNCVYDDAEEEDTVYKEDPNDSCSGIFICSNQEIKQVLVATHNARVRLPGIKLEEDCRGAVKKIMFKGEEMSVITVMRGEDRRPVCPECGRAL